jgi:hypothetical protein
MDWVWVPGTHRCVVCAEERTLAGVVVCSALHMERIIFVFVGGTEKAHAHATRGQPPVRLTSIVVRGRRCASLGESACGREMMGPG